MSNSFKVQLAARRTEDAMVHTDVRRWLTDGFPFWCFHIVVVPPLKHETQPSTDIEKKNETLAAEYFTSKTGSLPCWAEFGRVFPRIRRWHPPERHKGLRARGSWVGKRVPWPKPPAVDTCGARNGVGCHGAT